MELTTLWFLLIATLWCGYFLLEGFDFGAAMLMPVLARNDRERRVVLNTFGPVWDGNEVWLLVAGGATFAAFPEWYATLFSGFYLPLLLILVALIVRGVAFEYRGKMDDDTWRRRWDLCIVIGSALPAVLWGVAFGNIVRGVPLSADHEYSGSFFTLLNPYALLGGAVTLTLFLLHGAVFLTLRTTGEVRDRAQQATQNIAPVAIAAAVAFLTWTAVDQRDVAAIAISVLAALTLVAALGLTAASRDGWAFVATGATIVLATVSLFVALYPNVLPATDPANSLTVTNASSTGYTLTVMTWVALILTPMVVAYQAWTYWVFRARVGVEHIPALAMPKAVSAALAAPALEPEAPRETLQGMQ
ncbi:cytochrome d ubiquinol oxidase subunit II [Sporichthya polymorpha]|uniref:cytochrome d ubiquinol oxidase subunit II n=1 Tax=Sporichthya polymorpha TaxID=35751 RepID=UPI000381B33D|nr:cytochrome d ubiquinol oxidase subunit II [Sporichthya polymorpha]